MDNADGNEYIAITEQDVDVANRLYDLLLHDCENAGEALKVLAMVTAQILVIKPEYAHEGQVMVDNMVGEMISKQFQNTH